MSHQRSHTDELTIAAGLLAISDKVANQLRQDPVPEGAWYVYTPFETVTYLIAAMHSDVDAELQDDRDLHHVLSSWRDHLKRRQLEEDFSTLQGRPRPSDVRARK